MKKTHPNRKYNTFEKELIQIIEGDSWMLNILKIVSGLNLNDCWIGAGFIRNKIWDVKHEKQTTPLNDIDVIYFNDEHLAKSFDLKIENKLKKLNPNLNWSVKNQARMHIKNGHSPYLNCAHAISFWPETATAVATKINVMNQIECIAPYGLQDLFNLEVKPTPNFNIVIYKDRIKNKAWKDKWPLLDISFQNS